MSLPSKYPQGFVFERTIKGTAAEKIALLRDLQDKLASWRVEKPDWDFELFRNKRYYRITARPRPPSPVLVGEFVLTAFLENYIAAFLR